ncbi:MAG: glutamate synthase subunit beta [Thermoguttaceae bacterium]|nr:glutamate synthase subunit beta [Thermoguttaceae bacterium]
MSQTNTKDFMNISRERPPYRPAQKRVEDFEEVELFLDEKQLNEQARRCMKCGIPFCHGTGCPLGNLIPDFNAAAAAGDWDFAWELLQTTSSFPEFTSRVCPALCEGSCTSGISFEAVTIRLIEKAIVEKAFHDGRVSMNPPQSRNGQKVAVVGSGPAGLAAAVEMNKAGFEITVFEKNATPGGLLRYGIPDFKLAKSVIDRRLALMKSAGIRFQCGTAIGSDISPQYLLKKFDAVIFATGTPVPRDMNIPGRELDGIHFALDFLQGQNRRNAGELQTVPVSAEDKKVLVIGGGDTGSDCLGTCWRQKAQSVLQIEIMPKAPEERSAATPWPQFPLIYKTSSSHKEGGERRFNINTLRFLGENGKLTGVEICPVEWVRDQFGRPKTFTPLEDQKEFVPCDLVLLALGFLKQSREQMLQSLNMEDSGKIYIAGDAASGPSLVVKAIASGRDVANQAIQNMSRS